MPAEWSNGEEPIQDREPSNGNTEVEALIRGLELGEDGLTAKEFLQPDKESQVEEELSTAELIEMTARPSETAQESEDSDDEIEFQEEPVRITDEEGRKAAAIFSDYVSQFPDSAREQLLVQSLISFAAKSRVKAMLSQKQQKLTAFMPNKRARID